MPNLFDRKIKITIDGLDYEDLRMNFNIKKSLLAEPNTGVINIFNLARETRNKIKVATVLDTKKEGSSVIVEAGYISFTENIIEAEVTKISHKKMGPDWISEIQIGDGYTTISNAFLEKSFKKGTKLSQVIESIATSMNVEADTSTITTELGAKIFDKAFVVSGNAKLLLDTYTRQLGAKWSVQDGKLIILKNGEAKDAKSIIVSAETGLINAPVKTATGYDFTTLLNPTIKPGSLISIVSDNFPNASVIANKINYVGDNWDNTFYANVEGVEI